MKRINFYSVKMVKEKGGLYDLVDNFTIRSPYDGYEAIQKILNLQEETSERFGILTLNTKNQIVGVHIIFVGSLNCSISHPREIFQRALLNNAASIICFHNHPSGDPTPSREDIEVTKRLVECGKIMGIEVLDHVITGDGINGRREYVSMKEKGYC